MTIQVSVHDWLQLPMDIRQKLAVIFNLNRSGGNILEDNVVISDGYSHKDLAAITVDAMQKYLETYEINDFVTLFDLVIDKVSYKEPEPEPEKPDPTRIIVEDWVATLERIKKRAKEVNLEDHLKEAINQVFNVRIQTQEGPKKRGRPSKRNS